MSDNDYTWRAAVADARTAAAEAFAYAVESGENADVYDAAHDFADGSEWVIYTYRARCLWFDSDEVQGCEDDALECVDASADIDSRIRFCVYHALRDVFVAEWDDLAAAHAEALEAAEVEA